MLASSPFALCFAMAFCTRLHTSPGVFPAQPGSAGHVPGCGVQGSTWGHADTAGCSERGPQPQQEEEGRGQGCFSCTFYVLNGMGKKILPLGCHYGYSCEGACEQENIQKEGQGEVPLSFPSTRGHLSIPTRWEGFSCKGFSGLLCSKSLFPNVSGRARVSPFCKRYHLCQYAPFLTSPEAGKPYQASEIKGRRPRYLQPTHTSTRAGFVLPALKITGLLSNKP